MKKKLREIYNQLYTKHGPQGWFPLISIGYHPLDYTYPKNEKQKFEISIGTILTQNTKWENVEKALRDLEKKKLLMPKNLIKAEEKLIREIIRPTGYYNQKTEYILNFAKFFLKNEQTPTRKQLLNLKGIGPETCDSILLYAYKTPEFVIDTYTKRFFLKTGVIDEKVSKSYNNIKKLVETNLEKNLKIYQEFHALIVKEEKAKV